MIKIETKKELFEASINEIGKIAMRILKDSKDAKKYLKDQDNSDEKNLNAIMGTLSGISFDLKKIEEMKNALQTIQKF